MQSVMLSFSSRKSREWVEAVWFRSRKKEEETAADAESHALCMRLGPDSFFTCCSVPWSGFGNVTKNGPPLPDVFVCLDSRLAAPVMHYPSSPCIRNTGQRMGPLCMYIQIHVHVVCMALGLYPRIIYIFIRQPQLQWYCECTRRQEPRALSTRNMPAKPRKPINVLESLQHIHSSGQKHPQVSKKTRKENRFFASELPS